MGSGALQACHRRLAVADNKAPAEQRAFKAPTRPTPRLKWRNESQQGRICTCTAGSGVVEFSNGSGSSSFSGGESNSLPVIEPVVNKWAAWRSEVRRLKSQLQGWGTAGVMAYGLLNTIYYSVAFLIFWIYIAKVPKGLGWTEVSKQFATVMSLTWAASQLTKIPRAALALVLAPTVDGILIYLQTRLRLRSRRNASLAFVFICLLIVGITTGITLLLWV